MGMSLTPPPPKDNTLFTTLHMASAHLPKNLPPMLGPKCTALETLKCHIIAFIIGFTVICHAFLNVLLPKYLIFNGTSSTFSSIFPSISLNSAIILLTFQLEDVKETILPKLRRKKPLEYDQLAM